VEATPQRELLLSKKKNERRIKKGSARQTEAGEGRTTPVPAMTSGRIPVKKEII